MNILKYPIQYESLFWIIALTFSLYQGIRGIYVQIEKVSKKENMSKGHLLIVYFIHDFIFNFICTIAGFMALFITSYILDNITALSQIESGTGIIISFLFLIAIAGISGVLPPVLLYGRLK